MKQTDSDRLQTLLQRRQRLMGNADLLLEKLGIALDEARSVNSQL